MPLRLPPLSALRLFEAAGRHQSFKRAAAELHLTPSAVSHGIVGLEQSLGVALFTRSPQGLSLTPEGVDYLAYVSEAFSLIAAGTQRLPDPSAASVITLSCAPTLAARWLLPRLHRFVKRLPGANVAIDTSHRHVGFPVDGFDFAIRLSRAPVAGSAWQRLFGERLVPLCSPAFRDAHADADGHIDIRTAPRIHVTSASEDWQAWLDSAGMDEFTGFDPRGGLGFDAIQMAFDAAAGGLGIVMGRRPLVDDYLKSGALVPVDARTIHAEAAYWLVSGPDLHKRGDLIAFRDWIAEEAATVPDITAPRPATPASDAAPAMAIGHGSPTTNTSAGE